MLFLKRANKILVHSKKYLDSSNVLKKFKKITKYNYISFSGGLFNNVGLNNKIIESKIFDDVYFTFAPSDSGLSLGGALILWHKIKKRSN
ncbi:MAG: carbamoyltransferase N-terminal domain-containing protein [SAR324 cluster bacterium]|nr:carbamoyltransferase N-terminal domain-containing protein [SAR324 cluster bacterium]